MSQAKGMFGCPPDKDGGVLFAKRDNSKIDFVEQINITAKIRHIEKFLPPGYSNWLDIYHTLIHFLSSWLL